MKTARIGCMVLGIALLMFVIAPVASAQEGWYQGKVSVKGNEILASGFDKVSGGGKIFVRILVDDVNTEFDVYACVQGDTDWFGVWNYIPYANVYTDQSSEIWNLSTSNFVIDYGLGPNVVSKPMFNVKYSGTDKVDFKSFGCIYTDTSEAPALSLGSCTISFKRIPTDKVADKVPPDCLTPPPPHP